jgi:hypothetical protein
LYVVYVWRTVPSPHFGRVKRSGLEVAGREALEEQVRCIEGAGGTVCGAHRREGLAAEATAMEKSGSGMGKRGIPPKQCSRNTSAILRSPFTTSTARPRW